MNHSHYWILGAPRESWSLARCKYCKSVDAFPNHYDAHNLISKREFLRSYGVSKPYSDEEKLPVIKFALEYSISGASKKFKFPVSTIHNWVRGENLANKDKYTTEFKIKIVKEYEKTSNFYKTARKTGVPRSTLQVWVKQYAS